MADLGADEFEPRRRSVGSTFSALTVRNFRLLFIGQGISAVGNWSTLLTQSLLVFELTDNGALLGLVSACQFAPVLLLSSWTGLVADRSDKRRMMIRLQVLAMLQSAALCGVALTDQPSVALICGLASIGGVITAFDNPCRRALVVEVVPESETSSAVNLTSAIATTSSIIGPLVAGALILRFDYATVFAVDAVSYVAVLTALVRIDPAELRSPPALPRQRGQIRYGMRDVWNTPDLRLGMGVAALSGAAYNFPVVLPLMVHDVFDRSDGAFTVMYAFLSIGSVVGALSTGRRARVVGRDLVGGLFRFAAAIAVLAIVPWFSLSVVWTVAVGFTGMSVFTSAVTLAHFASGSRMRGRVMAFHSMCFLGSLAIGAPFVGWVCDVAGPRVGVLISAGFALSAALWALYFVGTRASRAAVGCVPHG